MMKKQVWGLLLLAMLLVCNTALADVGGICAGGYDNFNHAFTLTGNGAQDIVAVAQAQVGQTNATFQYWPGGWCAAFVNDCAYLAGQAAAIPFISGSTHAVGGLVNAVLNAGGYWVSSPQAGDLVIYYCTTDGYYCHAGIMENSSSTIQGNVSNACKRLPSPWNYLDEHGSCYTVQYLRPCYGSLPAPLDLGDSFLAKIHMTQGNTVVSAISTGNIQLATNADTAWQDWRFDRTGNGSYTITNLRNSQVMDLAYGGTVNGTNIGLCSRHADSDPSLIYQRWYIYDNGNGYYRLSPEAMPIRSLDATAGSLADGTNIQLWDRNDTAAQQVRIEMFGGEVLAGISCSQSDLTLTPDGCQQLSVSYNPWQGVPLNKRGIAWTSSDEAVATVDSTGLVTARGEGSCTITVTSTYNDSFSSTCAVTVESGIETPQIVALTTDRLNVHLSWSESPALDENDVRAYQVFVYPKANSEQAAWSNENVTDTACDITLSEAGEYVAYVCAFNRADGSRSSFTTKAFTVLDNEWLYCDELPGNMDNISEAEIQYLNQYNDREQEESPGEGWTQGESKTTYVNGGILYSEDPDPLEASDTRVYLGTFYYHYCDGSGSVEHYRSDRYCNHTRLDNNGQFDVVSEITDDLDPRFKLHRLKWNSGEWAGGYATCAYGSADAMSYYYIGHRYQERTAVTTYIWSKEATWSDEQDPNADSVSYRVREVSYDNRLVIPAGTLRIEAEAFANDTLIQEVVVPSGCEYIGSRAFAGCTELKRIHIPVNTVVEEDALEGCAQVQIIRTGE